MFTHAYWLTWTNCDGFNCASKDNFLSVSKRNPFTHCAFSSGFPNACLFRGQLGSKLQICRTPRKFGYLAVSWSRVVATFGSSNTTDGHNMYLFLAPSFRSSLHYTCTFQKSIVNFQFTYHDTANPIRLTHHSVYKSSSIASKNPMFPETLC